MTIAKIHKAVAAEVFALITWALAALADNHIDRLEWVALAAAIATGFGVYAAPRNQES